MSSSTTKAEIARALLVAHVDQPHRSAQRAV